LVPKTLNALDVWSSPLPPSYGWASTSTRPFALRPPTPPFMVTRGIPQCPATEVVARVRWSACLRAVIVVVPSLKVVT
jgi:hypothetical protein